MVVWPSGHRLRRLDRAASGRSARIAIAREFGLAGEPLVFGDRAIAGEDGFQVAGGGSVRASRAELDRVAACVEAAKFALLEQLNLPHWVGAPVAHTIAGQGLFAFELPGFIDRLSALQHGCVVAGEQYFGLERSLAHEMADAAAAQIPGLATGLGAVAPSAGLFREGEISITRTGFAGGISPPHSVVELAQRLQRTSTDGDLGQVAEFRLERFGQRVIVYVPGTKAWSPVAGENPLDLTSNVRAISPQTANQAASQRALLAALAAANVGVGDRVLLVGHSQGGIIAANIAAQAHEFQVEGLVTFGSPIAGVEVAPDTNVLALEHTNDPVPQLDGGANPIRENWVTVTEHKALRPGESLVGVHDLVGYVPLAAEVDAAQQVRLQGLLNKIRAFAGFDPGRAEWFAARRTS